MYFARFIVYLGIFIILNIYDVGRFNAFLFLRMNKLKVLYRISRPTVLSKSIAGNNYTSSMPNDKNFVQRSGGQHSEGLAKVFNYGGCST